MIRLIKPSDFTAVTTIYNHYIINTIATFEEEAITTDEMEKRINKITCSGFPWLVAEETREDGKAREILGFAYASKWKDRAAYRHTAEVTVYLSHHCISKGWGTKLYEALFQELKERSIHTVIGAIALPNPASIKLHERFGMAKVGHYKEIGFKFNAWVDTAYWLGRLNA